jgi:fibronectin-binding autotransporter adhesin
LTSWGRFGSLGIPENNSAINTMKIGTISRATKFSFAIATLAALLLSSSATFAGGNGAVSPPSGGFNILPAPPVSGGGQDGGGNNIDAARLWANTGTDFNTGASWTGGVAPGVGDVGQFAAVEATNPNLSSSISISGLYFSGTASSGYDVTSSSSAVTFTLTGRSTSGSGGSSDSSAAAIRSEITSGTNTIDAPLILAPSTGPSTFFLATGGTLVLNGPISDAGAGKALSLKNGTFQINGLNTFSGGTSIDAASTTVVLGNDSALGTGTFTINNTSTLQASSARTLANNVVLGGNTTISGGSAFTFNGTFTSSGSNTRTLTVSNTGGATLAGNVFLQEAGASGRTFTINGTSAVAISGLIADGGTGPATLKYTGSSTLTLSHANNTYSGGTQETIAGSTIVGTATGVFGLGNVSLTATSVTLTLQGASNNYIADTANLSFVSGDTINLNFTGIETIGALIVDNVSQPLGLYSASGTNPDGDLFGTGMLMVTAIAVPERSTWSMLVMGAALLVGVQRWRRRRTS